MLSAPLTCKTSHTITTCLHFPGWPNFSPTSSCMIALPATLLETLQNYCLSFLVNPVYETNFLRFPYTHNFQAQYKFYLWFVEVMLRLESVTQWCSIVGVISGESLAVAIVPCWVLVTALVDFFMMGGSLVCFIHWQFQTICPFIW